MAYQTLVEDSNAMYSFEKCESMHFGVTKDMLGGNCQPELNFIECVHDLGACYAPIPGCKTSFESKCLTCEEGFYLVRGKCLSELPESFHQLEGTSIALPSSNKTHRDIYVVVGENFPQNSTFKDLSTALASICTKSTRVYLQEGTHYLQPTNTSHPSVVYAQNKFSPLNSSFPYERVEILPMSCRNSECNTTVIIELRDPRVKLELLKGAQLSIRQVKLDGFKSLKSNCESLSCTYCPLLFYNSTLEKHLNDRNQSVVSENYPSNCWEFNEESFITVTDSNVFLENVAFSHFQQQYHSILNLKNSFGWLRNVSFEYVEAAKNKESAVISITCGSGICGGLSYVSGKVSFLNFGYEYQPNLLQKGFLFSRNLEFLLVHQVSFERNVIFSTEDEHSCLLRVNSAQTLDFQKNYFAYNWLFDSGFYAEFNSKQKPFVRIKDLDFYSNIVYSGGLVSINSNGSEPTIYVSGLKSFENTMINAKGVFYYTNTPNNNTQESLTLENLNIKNTYGGILPGIQISNMKTVQLKNSIFSGRKDNSHNAVFLSWNKGLYPRKAISLLSMPCKRFISVQGSVYFSVISSTFKDISCNSVFAAENLSEVDLVELSFIKNNATYKFGSVLELKNSARNKLVGIKSENNLGTNAKNIWVNCKEKCSTSIEDSLFEGNTFALGAGLYLRNTNFEMAKTQFKQNYAIEGAGLHLRILSSTKVHLLDSVFTENSSENGALYVGGVSGNSNFTEFKLYNLSFEGNQGNSVSCIYFSEEVKINKTSAIKNSKFKSNRAHIIGAIKLGNYPISILDSSFEQNQVLNGSLITMSSEKKTQTPFFMSDCVMKENLVSTLVIVKSFFYESQFLTKNLLLQSNLARGFFVHNLNWIDTGSLFKNNSNVFTSVATVTTGNCIFNGTQVVGNSVEALSGIVQLHNTTLSCFDCKFHKNQGNMGVTLYLTEDSSGYLYNSSFANNVNKKSSPALVVKRGKNPVVLELCSFVDNHSEGRGTLEVDNAVLVFKNSYMSGNSAKRIGPGILTDSSYVLVENSLFENQSGPYSVVLYTTTLSSVEFKNSTFRNLESYYGGVILGMTSALTLNHCYFYNNNAYNGMNQVFGNSNVMVSHTRFYNNTSLNKGTLFNAIFVSLTIVESVAENIGSVAIYGESLYNLTIIGSRFKNGLQENDGGFLQCISCDSIKIDSSCFRKFQARRGGVLGLTNSKLEKSYVSISNSSFEENTASSGGVAFIENSFISIENSVFRSNKATGEDRFSGTGGVLKPVSTSSQLYNLSVVDSEFYNNSASLKGGCIDWSVMPYLQNNHFSNNSAQYGADLASFGVKLVPKTARNLIHYEAAPGQVAPFVIILEIVDHYGNLVTTDNETSAEMIPMNKSTFLSKNQIVKAQKGVMRFDSFIINGEPGSLQPLKIRSSSLEVLLEVSLRDCDVGEMRKENECWICEKGKYSLNPGEPCKKCPDEAECYGGYSVFPKKGYWRPSEFTDKFFKCPNEEACLGGVESHSYTGECLEGYRGNMCSGCQRGYSYTLTRECQKCPGKEENAAILLGILLGIIVFAAILVFASIKMATKPTKRYSILFKILLNYIQIVGVVTGLSISWPDFSEEFMSLHSATNKFSMQAFSLDCFLMDNLGLQNEEIYFAKLTILSIVPFTFILVSLMFWLAVCVFKRKLYYLRNHLVSTIIILIFIIHPAVVRVSLSSLHCVEIQEGEYWINDNLNIVCFDEKHTFYSFGVALPCFLIWGVMCPLVALLCLYRNRNNLENHEVKVKFGFVIQDFKAEKYYWEFVIMYRKLLIIAFSVFTCSEVEVESLSIMIVLLICFYLNIKVNPYFCPALNTMESKSILVSVVTIYCGLYYLTQITYISKVFLFVVLVASNAVFLIHWLYLFLADFSKEIKAFCAVLFRKRSKVSPKEKTDIDSGRIISGKLVERIDTESCPPVFSERRFTHRMTFCNTFDMVELNEPELGGFISHLRSQDRSEIHVEDN